MNSSIITPTGTKYWLLNGKLHRTDGPAVEYIDGRVDFFLNGTLYPFEIWLKDTPISDEERVLLKLKYG